MNARKKIPILFFLAYLFSLLLCPESGIGQDEHAQADGLTTPGLHVFDLSLSESESSGFFYPLISEAEVDFKREPDLGKGTIYRKVFYLGKDQKTLLPFAWNKTTGMLYLDFNANFNLTDDPDNIFYTQKKLKEQVFKHIPISLANKGIPVIYYVDIHLEGKRTVTSYFRNVSAWKGVINLQNLKAEMTVTDYYMDGEITPVIKDPRYSYVNDRYHIKPLSLKDYPTTLSIEALVLERSMPVTEKIHINNCSYLTKYEFVKKSKETILRISFQETTPDTGMLRFSGQYIREIILFGEYHVYLFAPSHYNRIPSGTYFYEKVILQKEYPGSNMTGVLEKIITLNPGDIIDMKAGAPLKGIPRIYRSGNTRLYFGYSIQGTGNEIYYDYPVEKPPRIEISKGGKIILSDSYRFG